MSKKARGKKATFLLTPKLLDEVKAVVRESSFPSINAFVEQALSELVQRFRREQRRQAFAEASGDPLFLADLEAIGGGFEVADEESLPRIGLWANMGTSTMPMCIGKLSRR